MMRLPLIDPDERVVVTFNFAPDLGAARITGTPVVAVTLTQGDDTDPASLVSGAPVIDASQTRVLVAVAGRVAPANYRIKVRTDTTDPNLRLVLAAELVVRA